MVPRDPMEIQHLSLDQIRVRDSKYRFGQVCHWDGEDRGLDALANSIRALGVLQPLVVQRAGEAFHLVDGFKRAAIAGSLGMKALGCGLLPEETTVEAILELLLIELRHTVCATFASKARFVAFARRLGIEQERLVRHFLPLLDLQGHEAVLTKIEAIARLPEQVLDFCAEKNFSMRQCDQLTRFPRDLLLQVFSWRDRISLTASILEEILIHLHDHLRGTGQELADFVDRRDVRSLLASSLGPHERTERLRALIKERRYPVLTETNRALRRIRAEMTLPGNVDLAWDPTLERREVRLVLNVREPEEWEPTVQALRGEQVAQGMTRLLEIL